MDLSRLVVDGTEYRAVAGPDGKPVAVRGEHGTIYRLRGPSGDLALKIPDPGLTLAGPAAEPADLAGIPGLVAAGVRPVEGAAGAVAMPWVEGPTWAEVVAARRPLDLEECWGLARGLVRTLAELEMRGLFHGRLCGRHLLLPGLAGPGAGWPVELVDLEHLQGPGASAEAGEVPGYGSGGPRLAGAVLLAEVLGWWDPEVREAAWGEHYFAPNEAAALGLGGPESERWRLLVRALRERWGPGPAGLFERACRARAEGERPGFREWARALPPEIGALKDAGTADPLLGLLAVARQLESRGARAGSLVRYRQLAALLPAGSQLHQEVSGRIGRLEAEGDRCRQCGAQLRPGARFCSSCGARVGGQG